MNADGVISRLFEISFALTAGPLCGPSFKPRSLSATIKLNEFKGEAICYYVRRGTDLTSLNKTGNTSLYKVIKGILFRGIDAHVGASSRFLNVLNKHKIQHEVGLFKRCSMLEPPKS
jgi:hypothetical protein